MPKPHSSAVHTVIANLNKENAVLKQMLLVVRDGEDELKRLVEMFNDFKLTQSQFLATIVRERGKVASNLQALELTLPTNANRN